MTKNNNVLSYRSVPDSWQCLRAPINIGVGRFLNIGGGGGGGGKVWGIFLLAVN